MQASGRRPGAAKIRIFVGQRAGSRSDYPREQARCLRQAYRFRAEQRSNLTVNFYRAGARSQTRANNGLYTEATEVEPERAEENTCAIGARCLLLCDLQSALRDLRDKKCPQEDSRFRYGSAGSADGRGFCSIQSALVRVISGKLFLRYLL